MIPFDQEFGNIRSACQRATCVVDLITTYQGLEYRFAYNGFTQEQKDVLRDYIFSQHRRLTLVSPYETGPDGAIFQPFNLYGDIDLLANIEPYDDDIGTLINKMTTIPKRYVPLQNTFDQEVGERPELVCIDHYPYAKIIPPSIATLLERYCEIIFPMEQTYPYMRDWKSDVPQGTYLGRLDRNYPLPDVPFRNMILKVTYPFNAHPYRNPKRLRVENCVHLIIDLDLVASCAQAMFYLERWLPDYLPTPCTSVVLSDIKGRHIYRSPQAPTYRKMRCFKDSPTQFYIKSDEGYANLMTGEIFPS